MPLTAPEGDSLYRNTYEGAMTTYKAIKVEKPLSVEDLMKKPTPRGRQASPRDVDSIGSLKEVAAGPRSQVLPWRFDGKPPTARLAAKKAIERSGLEVFVEQPRTSPGLLLFSRVPLSGRQGKKA